MLKSIQRSNKQPSPVILEDKAWIGVNTVIPKGVTIGKNNVMEASSLGVKEMPPKAIARGNL